MFKLTIEDDEGKTTVVPLARDEMTIGRLEGNSIRLTERNVSRKHARLSRQNGALYIEDLASFTGVRVNGAKIASPTPLREGDEVQIGDYRIVLRGERPAVADRPTMPSMPAALGPMATVGGAVAIPTRASVAAMAAAEAAAPAAAAVPPAQAQVRSRTKTSPPKPFPAAPPLDAVPAAAPAPVAPAAAAPEPVEGQPTIPLRAVGDQVAGQPVGASARLFVLTTELAGSELPLDKASLVIGRTDENDLVLNHRSISRHHAKIVRDGEHYTIVDLQSANGVRVNGEDYERIELNPGDVIELGHVKIRFVGPLEQFLFDPLAVAGGRRLPVKWVAGGGGALAAIALVVLFLHHGSHEAGESRVVASPAPVAVAAPPAPVVPAAPVAPAPPPPTTPSAILAAVKQAMAAEDWEAARNDIDRLAPGTDEPGARRELAATRRRVEIERQGAILFARFDEAANGKSYADAVVAYDRISPESVYKQRARSRYEEARTLLVAEHLATAEKARAAGRCSEVRTEADAVLNIDSHNLVVRDLVKLCRARAEPVALAPVRPARARPESVAPVRPARARPSAALAERSEPVRHSEPAREEPARSEAVSPPETEDADSLMKQAREAWLRQQCGSAMDLSRRALRARPGLTDAYQILAVCSCSLKDAEAAGRAYSRLDDKNRSLVHAVCQKNGVSVGD